MAVFSLRGTRLTSTSAVRYSPLKPIRVAASTNELRFLSTRGGTSFSPLASCVFPDIEQLTTVAGPHRVEQRAQGAWSWEQTRDGEAGERLER